MCIACVFLNTHDESLADFTMSTDKCTYVRAGIILYVYICLCVNMDE